MLCRNWKFNNNNNNNYNKIRRNQKNHNIQISPVIIIRVFLTNDSDKIHSKNIKEHYGSQTFLSEKKSNSANLEGS